MSASPTTNDRNLALLTKAREMIAKGDLKNAAITLNDANRAMPGDTRVFMLGGLMAEKAGNTTGAFELLRKTVKMAPEWGPGLLELALLLARNNQFPEAIATAEKVQQLEPNNPMVLAGSIDIAHRAGRLDIAVRLLRHGLRLHPNDPQLTFELANYLATLGSQQEALALWNQLIENNPSAPDLLLGGLKTQIALNNFSAAQSNAAAASAMMVLAGLVETAAEPAPSDELGGAIAIIDAAAGELGRGSRVQWSGGATTQAPAIDDATDDPLLDLIPDGILLGPAVAAQQLATDLTITIRASDDVRAAALVGFFAPEPPAPTDYVDHDWKAETWSRGCYAAVMPPGVLSRVGGALRAPCGRVHFAGTVTATRCVRATARQRASGTLRQ